MQAGQRVLDFGTVVEALPAGDAVRNPCLLEAGLQRARLRVRAVEHGDGPVVARDPGARPVDRERCFFRRVLRVVDRGERRTLPGGAERVLQALSVVADHSLGGLEERRRGAVRGVEVDPPGVREDLLEVQDVAEFGSPPAVDGLVGVADDEHVVVFLGDQPREHVLRRVGVLALVDEDVAVPPGDRGPGIRLVMERPDGSEEHVVEVEAVGLAEDDLVGVGKARVAVPVLVLSPGFRAARVLHHVLEHAHPLDEGLRLPDADVDAGVEHALAHDVELLGLVGDPEVGPDAAAGPVLAQDASAQPVEGGDPHPARDVGREEFLEPAAHLAGRLPRERDGGDLARRGAALLDEVGNPRDDDARLAGAGAGDDEDGSVGGGGGFPLPVVQVGEERLPCLRGRPPVPACPVVVLHGRSAGWR